MLMFLMHRGRWRGQVWYGIADAISELEKMVITKNNKKL